MADCTTNVVACETPASPGAAKSLSDKVAAALEHSQAGPQVADAVVKQLTDREVNRRVDLVVRGLARQEELRKQLDGLTPDQQVFAEDGSVASEGYSAARLKQRAEAKSALDRVTAALDAAVGQGSYCCLKKVLG